MKYIRTKDKIYKIDHISGLGIVYIYHHRLNMVYDLSIKDSATGKQANTIEELCDEFVLISELEKRIIKPKELNKDCEGWTKEIGIPEGIIKVYGAIWVIDSNGTPTLKPVAKANKKGELELL